MPVIRQYQREIAIGAQRREEPRHAGIVEPLVVAAFLGWRPPCSSLGKMATRRVLDLQPGVIPDIRADGDRITYRLEIAGTQAGGRLIIRCDPDGTVWASIGASRSPRRPDAAG